MIVKNHLKTWFIVDVISVWSGWYDILSTYLLTGSVDPDEEYQEGSTDEVGMAAKRARIFFKWVRVFRVLKMIKSWEYFTEIVYEFATYLEFVMRLLQLMFL